jgi:putative ABC transport system permease protein
VSRVVALADRLLRLVLPEGPIGESIRGDLLEDWQASDRPGATVRYLVQALSIASRYAFRSRLRRAPAVPRRGFMETIQHDLRSALRSMRARPGFSAVAIVILALGIGANTAMFGIVNALLLRPLPFDEADRLVAIYERDVIGGDDRMSVAPGNFLDWQRDGTSLEHISAQSVRAVIIAADSGSESERVAACVCSGNLFSTLRVTPAVGRIFRDDEDRFGAPRVAIIGFDVWQRHFGGARDVIGKSVRLDNDPYEIVGVAPPGLAYPSRTVQVWVPFLTSMPPQQQIRHDLHNLRVIGRLHAGVTRQQAEAEIDGISARYKAAHPGEATGTGAALVELHDDLMGDGRRTLLILLGAVGCVLLIACLNIASLMLTQVIARTREIGIRTALGASRGQIVRQLIVEGVVLGLFGGVAGGVCAYWIANFLVAQAPAAQAILPVDRVPIDLSLVLFALVTAVGSGIVVGILPALRSSRVDSSAQLKDGGRSLIGQGSHRWSRDVLIGAEVALSLLLLTFAGLLVHSLVKLYDVPSGVRTENLVMLGTAMPGAGYREAPRRSATLAQLGEELRAIPGVTSVGLTSCTPLTGACNTLFFYIEGRPYEPGKFLAALERSVDPGYFTAAGIPLLRGRSLTREDGVGFDPKSPRTGDIVISESMAHMFFPGEDPIGKRIFFDFEVQRERIEGFPAPRYEIVGVVGDVLPGLEWRTTPTMYRPLLDVAPRSVTALLHVGTAPAAVVGAARDTIRRVDGSLPIFQVQTMEDVISRTTSGRRFTMAIVVGFAGLAALLAAIGLYGLVTAAVSQRTAEIGIRLALGASTSNVRTLMVMQGLVPAVAGVIVGLVGAAFASTLVASLLFGVTTTDPTTFVAGPVLLLTIAALACYVPARRATSLDPTQALRENR